MRVSILHELSEFKNKITVVGVELIPLAQFLQDVTVVVGFLLSSETAECVGTGTSTEIGNVQ